MNTPLNLSTIPLPRLEAAIAHQSEREPAGKPFPRWAWACGHVARTGGVCESCLRAELERRRKEAVKG